MRDTFALTGGTYHFLPGVRERRQRPASVPPKASLVSPCSQKWAIRNFVLNIARRVGAKPPVDVVAASAGAVVAHRSPDNPSFPALQKR
jgi:hypothetical protein